MPPSANGSAKHSKAPPRSSPWLLPTLAALFAAAGLGIYGPALQGTFLSDDQHYVWDNPYIQDPTVENLGAILDPRTEVASLVNNYAPVHLLLYAAQWPFFGHETTGYHVVNVLFHAAASLALVIFFRRVGIGAVAAAAGGAIFLVHPANVEAVAWISQLKSPVALLLSVAALFAHPRRPLLAVLLFALALLAKPSALFALPVAAVMTWLDPESSRRHWAWLGVWALVLAAFTAVEVGIYLRARVDLPPLYEDPWVQLRTSAAIGLRYLAMATTGYGLSTFHEPPPVQSWLDPWWLGSLGALGLLVWRILVDLRARRTEVLFWTWAAASFAPVSGILSLPFPMADRYLYFILPGLIGVVLLGAGRLAARLEIPAPMHRIAGPAVALLVGALSVAYGAQAHERAGVWINGYWMMADAERHYPHGMSAKTRQATRAAREGRVGDAAEALRAAHARGYRRLDQILHEPAYQPYLSDPRLRKVLVEIADHLLEIHAGNAAPSQRGLRTMALAHHVRGETERAVALLERALEAGGPLDDVIRSDLADLRRAQRLQELRERRDRSGSNTSP